MPIIQRLFRRMSPGLTTLGVDPADAQATFGGGYIQAVYGVASSDKNEQLFPSRRWVHTHGTYTSPAFAGVFSLIEVQGPYPSGCWVYSIRNMSAAVVRTALSAVGTLITANRDDSVSGSNFYGDESIGGNPNAGPNFEAVFQTQPTGLGGTGPPFISVGTNVAAPAGANSVLLSLNNQVSLQTPIWVGPGVVFFLNGTVANTAIVVDIGVQLIPWEG